MGQGLSKQLILIFIILAVAALGLLYYLYINSELGIVREIGKKGDVELRSLIQGVNVSVIDKEEFTNAIKQTKIGDLGIRESYRSDVLVYPDSISIELVSELQPWLKMSKQNSSSKSVSIDTSLGFSYDPQSNKMNIYLYYNPEYIGSLTDSELEKEISEDILFYLYVLSGDKSSKVSPEQLFPEANKFSKDLFDGSTSLIRIIRE